MLAFLLAQKPDCNTVGINGSPLDNAVLIGNEEMVKMLLDAGADPNLKYVVSKPLINACLITSVPIASLLLDKGADINCNRGIYGPPIFIAIYRGSKELVELLLRHGADVKSKVNGQTPLESARAQQQPDAEIIRLLEAAGNEK